MGLFNNFPYLDLSNLNLDFILREIRKLKDYQETASTAAESAEQSATSADNARQQAAQARNAAEQFAANAHTSAREAQLYADNIADPVAGLVASWLGDHITNPSNPPLDTSLTVANAAADAKAAGDMISIVDAKHTAFEKGISFTYEDTYSAAQTVYKTFDIPISAGTEVLFENHSENTPVNVCFRNASGTEITTRVTIYSGHGTIITPPEDAYSARLYVNGTELNASLSYGANAEKQMEDVNDIFKVNTTLNDGYYTAQGTIEQPSATYAEKYTDRLPVYEGLKIIFTLRYITTGQDAWAALCTWTDDGVFTRTTLDSGNYRKNVFEYTVPAGVKYVALTFRSYNDYSFDTQVNSSAYDVYKMVSAGSGKRAYAFNPSEVKGINHRGYNSIAPENTIPAYQLSVEHGFKFVETDVRFTSDNVPVLLHDATINRTSNGTGDISSMTFAQVREYDFGSWKSSAYAGTKIPSFEEFIIFCKHTGVYPYVELSAESYTDAQISILCNIAKEYGMDNAVTWIGSNTAALTAMRNLDAGARLGVIVWGDPGAGAVTMARSLMTGYNDVFLDLDITYMQNAVTLAKNASIPLELWTSNSSAQMIAADPYINGITSDQLNYAEVIKQSALG